MARHDESHRLLFQLAGLVTIWVAEEELLGDDTLRKIREKFFLRLRLGFGF